MDYGVFRETDGRARREVIEIFSDWEYSNPEREAVELLHEEYKRAQQKYKTVVAYPDGNGFTVFKMFGYFRIFIESGIFDYE